MKKEYITSYHFKRFLTSQPYFIWHSLKNKKDEPESFDDNFEIDFWTSKIPEEIVENVGAVVARTFSRIDIHLREKLQEENDIIIITGNIEQRIQKTKDQLKSNKILIDPVFEYKGALSKPFAFDLKNKTIINIKYAKKTKRADIVTGYYDYSIISKNIDVLNYFLYLPAEKVYKKNEISLIKTDGCHLTKTGDIPGTRNSKGEIKQKDFISFFETRIIQLKKTGDDILLPDFDDSLSAIEMARNIDRYSINEIALDASDFGVNPEWDMLIEELVPEFAGINGVVVKKTEIIDGDINIDSNLVLSKLKKINKATVIREPIPEYTCIKKSNKVVWYDFEGYSLPISPLNGVSPYQQLVFQVSVIVTEKNIETYKENFVIDPQKINIDNLYTIIEKVYQNGADSYVVYNKGYEIPRMKEITQLLLAASHPNYDKAVQMLEIIESNTVDLMDVFKVRSKKTLPPILLNDQKAKGSIKNIEKHITHNNIKLPRPITPYNELDVQNGGMAMNEAIHRALNITGDIEWNLKIEQLKLYCENDVKAMIMVYDFIENLLNK